MHKSFALSALLLVLAAGFSTQAAAREGTEVGASFGSARVDGGDFPSGSSDTGYKVFGGLHGEFWGAEVGYVDFGKLGGSTAAHAWTPAATLGFPVGPLTLYGKFGEAFYTVEGSGLRPKTSDDHSFFGFGVRAGAPTGLGFRVEYERYRLLDSDVDMASAGLEFRF